MLYPKDEVKFDEVAQQLTTMVSDISDDKFLDLLKGEQLKNQLYKLLNLFAKILY